MNFLNPWGFLALVGIPIIIVMYLLKQKYQEKQISSLFLWKKAIAVTQAHEPWQKWKKNLLFFLQILGVILIATALASPYGIWNKEITNYVLVLDASMSMQAKDESPTRFEYAKEQMNELIQSVPPQTKVTLICLGENPYIAVNASNQKQEVKRALQSQKAGNGGADWKKALPMIEMAQKEIQGQVILYTDHPYDMETLDAKQVFVGKGGDNCAITTLSHMIEDDGIYVLCRVKNFGKTEQKKTVTLFCDDVVQDVMDITVKPNEEQDIIFSGIDSQGKRLRAELSPEDVLQADDIAFDTLNHKEKRKVLLVTEGNVFLEKVLLLFSDIELYKTSTQHMDSLEGYSLYIFDGVFPKKLPEDGYFFFMDLPKENTLMELKDEMDTVQKATAKSQEEFSFLNGIEFDLSQARPILMPKWGTTLFESQGNALAIAGQNEGKKIMAFSFDLNKSDFPLKKEFPIFMYHVMDWFFPDISQALSNTSAGKPIEVTLEPKSKNAEIILPDGKEVSVAPPFPPEPFWETEQIGFYTVRQTTDDTLTAESIFAVNAKTEGESDISSIYEDVEQKNEKAVKSKAIGSLRNPILILLLCLLLAEWWVNCRE